MSLSKAIPDQNHEKSGHNSRPTPPRNAIIQLWYDYLAELQRSPLKTKSISAALTSIISDIIAQIMMGASITKLNYTSITNQAIIGLVLRGPLVHAWLIWLESLYTNYFHMNKEESNSLPATISKVALDQLLFSPIFSILYFYFIGILERKTLSETHAIIALRLMPILKMNWRIWPFIKLFNFKVVPRDLQVLFGNICGIFWTAYLLKFTRTK